MKFTIWYWYAIENRGIYFNILENEVFDMPVGLLIQCGLVTRCGVIDLDDHMFS